MTTSPLDIRELRPEYSTEATARRLEEEPDQYIGAEPGHVSGDGELDARTRRDQLKVISGQLKRAPIGYSIFVLSVPGLAPRAVRSVYSLGANRHYDRI